MISGKMYWHKDPKMSVTEIIEYLTEWYRIQDVKYVLVNRLSLDKEIVIDNIKIKPNKAVIKNHFWFIQENNIKNGINIPNWEK